MARFGSTLEDLSEEHPFRYVLADYLGQLCATLVLVASPELIVIGGGVMVGSGLHEKVEQATVRWLGGYVDLAADQEPFIVPPGLGGDAGVSGGFALAEDVLSEIENSR